MGDSTTMATLSTILPPHRVITNATALLTYERDASLDGATPDAAVFPQMTAEVVRLVRWAGETGIPLVARGAGTGLSGGAVAEHGGVVVVFSRMNKIVELDEVGRSVVVEPGVVNLVLDEFVKAGGLYYPPDPASGRTSTTGGNVAENAGGPHCFKYGVTTNYITGLEAVTADGQVVRLGGRALDYPELDLVGLMTGSEGTLAIITQASCRLLRNTPAVKTALASFDSVEEAGDAVSAVIAAGLVPATMELMDQKIMRILEDYAHAGLPVEAGAALIIEADGFPDSVGPQMDEIAAILRGHKAREIRVAQTAEERDSIWYGRKSAAGAMARLAPAYYLLDGAVPRSKLGATLAEINAEIEANGLQVGYVAHAGDGNLHPFILIEDPHDKERMARILGVGRRLMEICVEKGGSVTGEHGIGIEKREFMPLMFTPAELSVMKEIKDVFDPCGLLNPGKIIPAGAPKAAGLVHSASPRKGTRAWSPALSEYAPASADSARQAISAFAHDGKSIRVVGGGTKSLGFPAGDVEFHTDCLHRIKVRALEDLYVTAGAGARLSDLQAELAADKMWVPLMSPWPGSTAGGIVSANLNAPLRMRYGNIRDIVLGASVVLPDGRSIRAGRPVVKNVAGYDITKLFVGAWGTLGLLTDVSFKLAPLPRARASLLVPFDSLPDGLVCGQRLLRTCMVASALLLWKGSSSTGALLPGMDAPYSLIYTAEGMPEDVTAELEEVCAALRECRASGLRQVEGPSGNEIWASWLAAADAATTLRAGVPTKDLPRLATGLATQLDGADWIADIANGLLYTSGAELASVRKAALTLGGYAVSFSGAAGDRWGYAPQGLPWMQALKTRWDRGGLFNPGVFIV